MNQPLPPMPPNIARLPRDSRGFPIPWFVATLDNGQRDFRIADYRKRARAVLQKRCWVCGEPLGRFKCFVIGPMCVVNRVTSEPPCHLACAEFSARACPFLMRPRMRRNDKDKPAQISAPPGKFITRNPGVACLYTTRGFTTFEASGGWMIRLGPSCSIAWYAEGQPCGRDAVMASIESGYPILLDMAKTESAEAVAELAKQYAQAMALLPAE